MTSPDTDIICKVEESLTWKTDLIHYASDKACKKSLVAL